MRHPIEGKLRQIAFFVLLQHANHTTVAFHSQKRLCFSLKAILVTKSRTSVHL